MSNEFYELNHAKEKSVSNFFNDSQKVELWLRTVVEDIFVHKTTAKLQTFECSRLQEDEGAIAMIFKVRISWDQNDYKDYLLPTNLVVKVPSSAVIRYIAQDMRTQYPQSFSQKDQIQLVSTLFPASPNNECIVYQLFTKTPPVFPIPRCFGSKQMLSDEKPGYVVLEDLSRIARSGKLSDCISEAQCREVVRAIAGLQAQGLMNPSWKDSGIKVVCNKWFVTKVFDVNAQPAGAYLRSKFPAIFTVSDAQIAAVCDATKQTEAANVEQLVEQGKLKPVLVHGDLWLNNLMFAIDSHGQLTEELVAIIDWQNCHFGTIGEDIGRLCVQCLDGSLRREIEEKMLKLCYETLRNELLPPDFNLEFSYKDLRQSYADYLVLGACWNLVMGFHQIQQNDQGQNGHFDFEEKEQIKLVQKINLSIEDAFLRNRK